MYKVFIADDEPCIRNGLRDTIEWESLGLEYAGDAANGKEALRLIKERNPDILITDIKMPVMDGFTLIRELQSSALRTRVIVLSGYNDYQCLKEAITCHVESYLLKPIDHDELVSLLAHIVKTIEENDSFLAHQKEGMAALKRHVLNRLFDNTISVHEFREKASFFGMDLAGKTFGVAAFLLGDKPEAANASPGRSQLNQSAERICERVMGTELSSVSVTDTRGHVVCLLAGGSPPPTVHAVRRLVAETAQEMEKSLGVPVTVGIGGWSESPEKVWQSYAQALRCLDYAILVGNKPVVDMFDFACHRTHPDQGAVIPDVSLITDYLLKKRKRDLAAYLKAAFIRLSETEAMTVEDARAVSMQIVISVMTLLRTMKGDIVYLKNILNFNYADLLGLNRLADFEYWLSSFCAAAIDFISDAVEGAMPNIVRETIAYIEKNYAAGLSLKLIAYLHHVNAAYLGQVFKKEVGQSFVHYVNAFRIQKARELLADTPLKIHQVARKVGFSDSHYFLRIFKKHTGLRPSDLKHP
jgi:two-component system response regulator YesN